MKKLLAILVALIAIPMAFAIDVGTGIGIDFDTEQFGPRIWMCDNRKVIDDPVEPGRVDGDEVYSEKIETCEFAFEACHTSCEQGATSWCYSFDGGPEECWEFQEPLDCSTFCFEITFKGSCDIEKGYELIERHNNYAFEGEKIEWLTLVMDKNKIEEIKEVVATIGSEQGTGNDVEVECVELHGFSAPGEQIKNACNARIDEEKIEQFDDQIMAYYECTLTVETPDSMYGEYFVTVEAIDSSGLSAIMDENEYWFLNPIIALSVVGDVSFGTVRPGTIKYSPTILVGNDADEGSGVTMDMFISGTDFYDPLSQGSRCVITNRLKLGNNYVAGGTASNNNRCNIGFGDTDDHLCYYATNGAYGTQDDLRSDVEGYAPIVYGDAFTRDFYNDAEIIQDGWTGSWWHGNWLTPGAEMAVTFKLGLPLPCVGDFTDGDINFWGEAI